MANAYCETAVRAEDYLRCMQVVQQQQQILNQELQNQRRQQQPINTCHMGYDYAGTYRLICDE